MPGFLKRIGTVVVFCGVCVGLTTAAQPEAASVRDRGGWIAPEPIRSSPLSPEVDVRFDLRELRKRLSMLNVTAPRERRRTEMPLPGERRDLVPLREAANVEPLELLGRTSAEPGPNPLAVGALTDTTVSATFRAGVDDLRNIPPDPAGAVGPRHIVTVLNSQIFFLNRDGSEAAPPVRLSDFFAEPIASFEQAFDPRIEYDPTARRWYIVTGAAAFLVNNKILFAVSDTEDPTRGWRIIGFRSDQLGRTTADFPGLGYNRRWLAITANVFSNGDSNYMGMGMWVIPKSSLGAGEIVIRRFPVGFDLGPNFRGVQTYGFSMQPAVHHDALEDNLYFAGISPVGGEAFPPLIRLSRLTGPDNDPAWAPIDGGIAPGTGLFELPNRFSFDVPKTSQATTSYVTDGGDARISSSPKYRNGRLWITHAGGVPVIGTNRVGVFWYEVDPLALEQDLDPVVQSGVIEGGSRTSFIFPSIAVNANNDAVVGYSVASPDIFIGAALSARLASDPAGAMRPLQIFQPGLDTFIASRWGDYSSAVVDPNDDTTLWTVQSFADERSFNPSSTRWGVQWARIGPGPDDPFCEADLTTTGAATPNLPGFGFPDGTVDHDDLAFYLSFWLGSVESRADLTTDGASLEGFPSYGIPDGRVTLDDLGYFLGFWLTGCP